MSSSRAGKFWVCKAERLEKIAPEFMKTLTREFFQRDPLTCARELIGCELVWNQAGGVIVETEAYSARNDEACHTFSRPSSRRFVAEKRPGAA